MAIVKAMLETGITPDFIVVDGAEGGTGAAPLEFADHVGMPMREGLLFVHNALVGAGLRERIRVGTSGKIVSAFDIACVLALGADWANSARGFMFAVGCIQSQSCHTNRCPTGVATQDALRQRALVPADKAVRVRDFHRNTLHALAQMLAAAGLARPSALRPHHLQRRVSAQQVVPFSQLYPVPRAGRAAARRAPARRAVRHGLAACAARLVPAAGAARAGRGAARRPARRAEPIAPARRAPCGNRLPARPCRSALAVRGGRSRPRKLAASRAISLPEAITASRVESGRLPICQCSMERSHRAAAPVVHTGESQ
jgi:hypothetical protein